MFSINQLNVTVNNTRLLQGISVGFTPGKITAIFGANGAGKSTLFKALLGEYRNQGTNKNTILFDGTCLSRWDPKELSKCRAYVAQGFKSSFGLPVLEYLLLARENYLETESKSLSLVANIADFTGICALLPRCITKLSGGELQLVEFARAYLQLTNSDSMQGKCLLLDEPASALDIKQRQKLYSLIALFQKKGGTALLIDHDINAVGALAQEIVLLGNGRLIASGKKDETFTQAYLNQCFDVSGSVDTSPNGNRVFIT